LSVHQHPIYYVDFKRVTHNLDHRQPERRGSMDKVRRVRRWEPNEDHGAPTENSLRPPIVPCRLQEATVNKGAPLIRDYAEERAAKSASS